MRSRKQERTHNVRRGAPLMTEWCERFGTLCLILAVTAMVSPAQNEQPATPTFTTLHSFDGTDGANPFARLVQATDGNLYGTTYVGGANGLGTAFKITLSGAVTTLYSFCSQSNCTDGYEPAAGLVQGTDGNFYGTTVEGGGNFVGTVFKITPGGTLTTLYSFRSQGDGEYPSSGALVQGTDGNFYGTTLGNESNGFGTVFKITPSGALTTLYRFCFQTGCPDGEEPFAALVQGTDGNFYGTTELGGANGYGTVFKITPSGMLTTLHSFDYTDGRQPRAALMQATNGNFYGTTELGGANGYGTVFKITPSGTLTTLYSFCSQAGCPDGEEPPAVLVQGTDGNFYGTTYQGGANGYGTVFKFMPSGTLTTLHSFCSQGGCTDGAYALAGLVQDTNGKLYGATDFGGANGNHGTVFGLSVGLGPFVETQTTSGKVGAVVKILGTNLTGATGVSFNGTAAVFKVISPSAISATVPEGAASGTVEVTTPLGTLKSNLPFRVRP